MNDLEFYMNMAQKFVITYGAKLVLAALVLLIGLFIINKFVDTFNKWIGKTKIDVSLKPFLVSLLSAFLKTGLIVSVLSMVGIATTSLVAILGSAGLAIGLALQGSLANFAGGMMILLFRPFKLGDFVEVQGFSGTVKEIKIFCTILGTPDNKTIIVPNGPLASGSVINYSTEPTRRVDLVVGISYNDDLKKAKTVLEEILAAEALVLKNPAPAVSLKELADSSVNFNVRPWCQSEDYWTVYSSVLEQVKLRFDAEGISIPYPQMDVYMQKGSGEAMFTLPTKQVNNGESAQQSQL